MISVKKMISIIIKKVADQLKCAKRLKNLRKLANIIKILKVRGHRPLLTFSLSERKVRY